MQSTSNFLTRNQKDILKARHRQERDKKLCDRIKSTSSTCSTSRCRLNQNQLMQRKVYVKQEVPSSAKKAMGFIKEHFAIKYTLSATISLLHRLNFIY
ncbi:MAG: hypothetical protein C5B45_06605, partial [Chlamydiae bacterium]